MPEPDKGECGGNGNKRKRDDAGSANNQGQAPKRPKPSPKAKPKAAAAASSSSKTAGAKSSSSKAALSSSFFFSTAAKAGGGGGAAASSSAAAKKFTGFGAASSSSAAASKKFTGFGAAASSSAAAKSTGAAASSSSSKEADVPIFKKVRMIRKVQEVAFRERKVVGEGRERVEEWKVGEMRDSAIGWTPVPLSGEGATAEQLDEIAARMFEEDNFGRGTLKKGGIEALVKWFDAGEDIAHKMIFDAANPEDQSCQELRAAQFWREVVLQRGDLVVVAGGSNMNGYSSEDRKELGPDDQGAAVCMVSYVGKRNYSGPARVGQGGSATTGQQQAGDKGAGPSRPARNYFSEMKYYLRLEVLFVCKKGESTLKASDGGGGAIVVSTNNNVSEDSDYREKIWKLLSKAQQDKITNCVNSASRRGAVENAAKWKSAPGFARSRAVPMYTSLSHPYPDSEKPAVATFDTLELHLGKRSLPYTEQSRPGIGGKSSPFSNGGTWKRFGYVCGGLAECARAQNGRTPVEDFLHQMENAWVRELWRQVCELTRGKKVKVYDGPKKRWEEVEIYFTALGVGRDTVTDWHCDAGNDEKSWNFQACLGDYGCAMGTQENQGRVILSAAGGVVGKAAGDEVRTIAGATGKSGGKDKGQVVMKDCRRKWVGFGPLRRHKTEPFTVGTRWTVTCFTHPPPTDKREAKALSEAMRKAGTPLPPWWKK